MKANEISSSIYSQLVKQSMNQNKNDVFKNSLLSSVNQSQPNALPKSNALTFENIQGLNVQEIDSIFTNEQSRQMAHNLKLATDFSSDPFLSKPLFNAVFSQDEEKGYEFLKNMYEDKNQFLSAPENLGDFLESSIQRRSQNKEVTQQISSEQLDKILTTVNSFNFVNTLTNTASELKDKYKDNETYSSFFSDYSLQYETLKIQYEDEKYKQMNLIKQF